MGNRENFPPSFGLTFPRGKERGIPGAMYVFRRTSVTETMDLRWDHETGDESFSAMKSNIHFLYLGNGRFFMPKNKVIFFLYHESYKFFNDWFELVVEPE